MWQQINVLVIMGSQNVLAFHADCVQCIETLSTHLWLLTTHLDTQNVKWVVKFYNG
jgi:hypothetical protein